MFDLISSTVSFILNFRRFIIYHLCYVTNLFFYSDLKKIRIKNKIRDLNFNILTYLQKYRNLLTDTVPKLFSIKIDDQLLYLSYDNGKMVRLPQIDGVNLTYI